jgi:hypothetical protein
MMFTGFPSLTAPVAAPPPLSEVHAEYKMCCAAFGAPSGIPDPGQATAATAEQAKVTSNFKVT